MQKVLKIINFLMSFAPLYFIYRETCRIKLVV